MKRRGFRSPTSTWREDPSVLLFADLDSFELSGVRFGDDVGELEFLGRSESPGFDYPSKGLQLEVDEEGRFGGLVIAVRDGVRLHQTGPGRVHAFAGRIRIAGRDRRPIELRGESDFVSVWGEPFWRDVDEDEILLFFEFNDREIQVELSVDGVPQVLVVTSEPLMADPAQRREYGVTKSWPPRHPASER